MNPRPVLRLALPILVALSAACTEGERFIVDPNAPRPFDNIEQAKISYALKLFGGSGQWDFTLKAVVHNTTDVPRAFATRGFCPLVLQVFANPEGTGTPVWDERVARGGCNLALDNHVIAPGDSLVISGTQTTTNEILAHYGTPPANPPGTYYFIAVLPTALVPSGEDKAFVGFALLK